MLLLFFVSVIVSIVMGALPYVLPPDQSPDESAIISTEAAVSLPYAETRIAREAQELAAEAEAARADVEARTAQEAQELAAEAEAEAARAARAEAALAEAEAALLKAEAAQAKAETALAEATLTAQPDPSDAAESPVTTKPTSIEEVAEDTLPAGTVSLNGRIWTVEDNGRDVDWNQAGAYCRDLRLGGYADWALATADQIATLYDESERYKSSGYHLNVHVKNPIKLTGPWVWTSEERDSGSALYFDFLNSNRSSDSVTHSHTYRALCVRVPAE